MTTTMTSEDMGREIARAAAGRRHHLAPYLVDGRPVSAAQFNGIMRYLEGCRPASEGGAVQERKSVGDISKGYYATRSATGNNDLDFWKVTEGRKEGIRFARRVIGGGSAALPQTLSLSVPQQMAALSAILRSGVEESAALYAESEARCSDCGRQLTDEESRRYGKGPVCRSK